MSTLLVVWAFVGPTTFPVISRLGRAGCPDLTHDPPDRTFYDDPELGYSIGDAMEDWDEKRREWVAHHPSFQPGSQHRVLLLTGSQPKPCGSPVGDHLLLRLFKNKVDYCRLHGCDVFYNNAHLHQEMNSFWAKLPVVRAAMVAHPEAEWLWWVDSDAVITDMDFKIPLARYASHNMVVHGWAHLIYEERSWTSLNAGVFLIRNCQWSMDLLETWAEMGPQSPDFEKWGEIQRSTFKDKLFPGSDDQAGLIYLLLRQKDRWADKVYLEGAYNFESYWVGNVGELNNSATARYVEMEREVRTLRRRHAEKVSERYGALREDYFKEAAAAATGPRGRRSWGRNAANKKGLWKRPFITHFTGCQPCSGNHNPIYTAESCTTGMERALNYADNQVLRNFGFVHPDVQDSATVSSVPFDYPA